MEEKTLLITGTSSGLGEALATWALDQGHRVIAVSRRGNERLAAHPSYREERCDLTDASLAARAICDLVATLDPRASTAAKLDLAVLNAGILSRFGDMVDADLHELEAVLRINVLANQTVLQTLARSASMPARVVAISSGAAVNGRRGWGGYALSKAALNMLVQLWARERPATHFCALAPGLVDTAMQDELCALAPDERFSSLDFLRSARHTKDMPAPHEAAALIGPLCFELERHCESGGFVDVRALERDHLQS